MRPYRFVRFGSYATDFGREVANELLTRKNPPTAIFAVN
jgi:DNA-binding LacI/PurR family transcriptional regulator